MDWAADYDRRDQKSDTILDGKPAAESSHERPKSRREDNSSIKINIRNRDYEVLRSDATGSQSCPMACFVISGNDPSSCVTTL